MLLLLAMIPTGNKRYGEEGGKRRTVWGEGRDPSTNSPAKSWHLLKCNLWILGLQLVLILLLSLLNLIFYPHLRCATCMIVRGRECRLSLFVFTLKDPIKKRTCTISSHENNTFQNGQVLVCCRKIQETERLFEVNRSHRSHVQVISISFESVSIIRFVVPCR